EPDVLRGDGAAVGELAAGDHPVVVEDVVMTGGDGDAVVGGADDGVVVRRHPRGVLARVAAVAVAEHDPAPGEAVVILVRSVGIVGPGGVNVVRALHVVVVNFDRAGAGAAGFVNADRVLDAALARFVDHAVPADLNPAEAMHVGDLNEA